MILFGAVAGIGFMILMNRFNDEFKVKDSSLRSDEIISS